MARLRGARERLRSELALLLRQGPAPGLRTAKTVLAAVVSFAIAQALHTSGSPVLAPLTALLVVQLTMYETFAHGRERIVSVVAGVLLAVLFASFVGLTWWSLGIVVAVSILAGRLLRLGPHLLEVPISAMLVLAVGGAERAALGRVEETLIGAAIGVLVNLLIAPPLYVRPAGAAIAGLAEEMARFTADLADALRGTWSREVAQGQLNRARRLGEAVARADRQLARAEESARLNPRGRQAREAEPRLRNTLTALEHTQVGLRSLTRAVLDRTFFVPEEQGDAIYPPGVREALADVLEAATAALQEAIGIPSGASPGDPDGAVRRLDERRTALADRLLVDPRRAPAAWSQHGALLDAVDRLRVELTTTLRPPESPGPPAPLAERQRRAVRQALRTARGRPFPRRRP